ncbi:hypothetical protein CVT24_011530 [Panaeolus cyanescens]|uniref:TEL2-interacting protein 1 n=1 Tax=Panaeolus cyanescens TaxID=181874 RepID=A0A409VM90_9AGAR|nr:hypothetical protein CVT24_011530 [Panaeolus cyanescens]
MDNHEQESQKYFQALKTICVPLFASSNLSPSSTKEVSALLTNLLKTLQDVPPELLTQNLIQYTFMPVSMLLQRNPSSDIPDQVLELIFQVITVLVESWWWFCDIKIWEQLFMLSGSVLGGIERKGLSGKSTRDNETKTAAAQCLASLLRPRTEYDATTRHFAPGLRFTRLQEFQTFVQAQKFEPILGQTLDWLLGTASMSHLPLQIVSLDDIGIIMDVYFPESLLPVVFPGVISTMTRICLGVSAGKGWANSEAVSRALQVMQTTIPKAIGDEICSHYGLLSRVETLNDLFENNANASPASSSNKSRTESWLRGTSSQLHIALNSLSPLISHPAPIVLRSLSSLSGVLIRATGLTLPSSQPLLLSFLLVLSRSEYDSVASQSKQELLQIMSKDFPRHVFLQQTLMDVLTTNLTSVPRLLSSQAESKLRHVAAQIEAICLLGCEGDCAVGVARGIRKLLGPSGGVEKWGWQLLSAIFLDDPGVIITPSSSGQLALESDPHSSSWIYFPEIKLKNLSSRESQVALISMLHALGSAGGEECLYAIEWFTQLGRGGKTDLISASALWCAARLLEGVSGVSVAGDQSSKLATRLFSPRLQKEARSLVRSIAESWDQAHVSSSTPSSEPSDDEGHLFEHRKGLVPLSQSLRLFQHSSSHQGKGVRQTYDYTHIHRALRLQLLSVATSITQSRSSTLFIHILYPILHSIVSPVSFLSATGLAALRFITETASYASPANMLLANFDYILDAISRRFTRRWLDIDATKVMSIMVRLVGIDIVNRAEDLVEECFDRLDEYHGYSAIVDGLMEVLGQIVRIAEEEAKAEGSQRSSSGPEADRRVRLDDFLSYLPRRHEENHIHEDTSHASSPEQSLGDEPVEGNMSEGSDASAQEADQETPQTPAQIITQKIVRRSMYFLTHDSPTIRVQVLSLLTSSMPVLAQSELIPSIHSVWPFILNRLMDPETFVVSAAAELIEALSIFAGDLMFRKIWDDVWPKFRLLLRKLTAADNDSAVVRRTGAVDSASAYSQSHRLYKSILKTMTATLRGVHPHEPSLWEVLVTFRRFLSPDAHLDLQLLAKQLYNQASTINPDMAWIVLYASSQRVDEPSAFLANHSWNIASTASTILQTLG